MQLITLNRQNFGKRKIWRNQKEGECWRESKQQSTAICAGKHVLAIAMVLYSAFSIHRANEQRFGENNYLSFPVLGSDVCRCKRKTTSVLDSFAWNVKIQVLCGTQFYRDQNYELPRLKSDDKEKANSVFVLPHCKWAATVAAELLWNKSQTLKFHGSFSKHGDVQQKPTIAYLPINLIVDDQIKLLGLWFKLALSEAKRSDLTEWMQIFVLGEHFGRRKCHLHKIWSAALCVQ